MQGNAGTSYNMKMARPLLTTPSWPMLTSRGYHHARQVKSMRQVFIHATDCWILIQRQLSDSHTHSQERWLVPYKRINYLMQSLTYNVPSLTNKYENQGTNIAAFTQREMRQHSCTWNCSMFCFIFFLIWACTLELKDGFSLMLYRRCYDTVPFCPWHTQCVYASFVVVCSGNVHFFFVAL